ncbi:MAG: DUF3108 domain-containing protein [Pseudorhodobacter sp.]|nr:DUF3108 domain-containing protein [Pseudorhodobacter sp.]
MTRVIGNFRRCLVALGLVLGLAGGAQAQTDQGTFDLVMMGLKAGALHFTAVQDGKGYSVSGRLQSGGMVAMIRKVRYEATAQGSVSGARYTPTGYSELADTGKRQSESVMAYVGGVPQVKTYNPPRPPRPSDVDPATMGGTVDPLTALYATLRDVDKGAECQVDLKMFDGRRHSQIATSNPKAEGDRVVCAGEYRRLAGFSAKEMAEKQRFPFTLTYAPTPEGRMRVVEVAMDTLYGKASLQRR